MKSEPKTARCDPISSHPICGSLANAKMSAAGFVVHTACGVMMLPRSSARSSAAASARERGGTRCSASRNPERTPPGGVFTNASTRGGGASCGVAASASSTRTPTPSGFDTGTRIALCSVPTSIGRGGGCNGRCATMRCANRSLRCDGRLRRERAELRKRLDLLTLPRVMKCRIGVVEKVVISAMITSIANSVGEITFISRPILSTISSIRPRVFIRTPSADESRQLSPGESRRDRAAAELAERRDDHDQRAHHPLLASVDQPDLRAQAGVREEGRQQQHDHDVFEAIGQLARHPAVVRNHRAERERAEHGVDADQFSGRCGDQQRDEYRRHHALREPPAISVEQRQAHHRGPHHEDHQQR